MGVVDFEAINSEEYYELLQLIQARHAFVFSSTLLIISPFLLLEFVPFIKKMKTLPMNQITKKYMYDEYVETNCHKE